MDIQSFTNKELIRAIVGYMRLESHIESHLCDVADDIESGEWLNYYKTQTEDSQPHYNS
jgi:hypothetical protein